MKKILYILKITGVGIAVGLVMLCLWILLKLNNSWKGQISKNELIRITTIINDSPSFPQSLYQFHDSIYGKCRNRKAIWGLKNRLLEETKEYSLENNPIHKSVYKLDSPVNWVIYPLTSNGLMEDTLRGYWFSFGIQKYSTPEKCFDYYLHNADFKLIERDTVKRRITGIENLSNYLFGRKVESLKRQELLELFEIIEKQNEFMILTSPHIY